MFEQMNFQIGFILSRIFALIAIVMFHFFDSIIVISKLFHFLGEYSVCSCSDAFREETTLRVYKCHCLCVWRILKHIRFDVMNWHFCQAQSIPYRKNIRRIACIDLTICATTDYFSRKTISMNRTNIYLKEMQSFSLQKSTYAQNY